VSLRRAVDAVQRCGVGGEPAVKGGERHDVQAACEPGGGGCGGVPVHPLRLPIIVRPRALLTILTLLLRKKAHRVNRRSCNNTDQTDRSDTDR
jgi:hypothetical protein